MHLLNPNEYLNQLVKANLTGKMSINDPEDIEDQATGFLNRRKKNSKHLKKFSSYKVMYPPV